MWKYFIVLLTIFNSFAVSSSSILETSKGIFASKSTVKDLRKLSLIVKKKLKSKLSDDQYYLAYDLNKALDASLMITAYSPENCLSAKLRIYTLYGVKEIENVSEDLPKGALLGVKVLDKICSDYQLK